VLADLDARIDALEQQLLLAAPPPAAAAPPDFRHGHALVVGVTNYQHVRRLPPLHDAQDLATLLRDPAQCGYPPENVTLLVDEQATLAFVREALANLARRTDGESTVLVYFSGLGGRIEAGPYAGHYLLLVDSVYPDDSSLARTALRAEEFMAALDALPARRVLVILDCSHAGGIADFRSLTSSTLQPGLSESQYNALAARRGRVVMASSGSTEISVVLPGAAHGLFTEHLLGGLAGRAGGDDGFIRAFDLFGYVQTRVTAAHPNQHPVFKAEVEENFPVG